LPGSFHAALERSLLDLGLNLSPRQRSAIETHIRLLLAWNRHINLTAISEPAALAIDHVADSLSAVPVLRGEGVREVMDLGTGGGFPGLPIAAALPAARAILVESIAKKARFLRVVLESAGLSGTVDVAGERAEQLGRREEHRERWPAVTARAVGSLVDIVEIGLPLVALGGLLIAWKRSPIDAELEEALAMIGRLGGDPPRIVAAGLPSRPHNVLVVVAKRRPTPDGYPRDPAVRRRRPGPHGPRLR
jgi:16S rRNA (guanine527-N7)-methyltransferase